MGHLKEIFNRPFTLMRQIFISLFVLLIFSAGLGNKVFTLGYSYDMNRSGLNHYSSGVGASELSLILKNPIDHMFKSVDTPRI